MPNASVQTHVNKVLSNIAVQYRPMGLAWDQIFLRQSVSNETDLWPVYDKNLFDVLPTLRTDGEPSNRSEAGWKLDTYACVEDSLHEVITERMRRNSVGELDLDMDATERVKQRVWNGIELKVFGTGGILRTAANCGYSANVSWANQATAVPKSDIEAAISAIEVAAGVMPNTIVMTPAIGRWLMGCASYQNERRYVMDLTEIGGVKLPSEFYGLRAVYVAASLAIDGSGNPLNPGQPYSMNRVMGDDVWLGYVNPGGPGYKQLTYGASLYTNEYTSSWYEENLKGDKIEYGMIHTEKVIAKECGALLTSVLT